MKDVRQTIEYAEYLKRLGWKIEKNKDVNYFVKKIFAFSILKVSRPERIDIKKLFEIAKKNKSVQLSIEPKDKTQENILKENKFGLEKLSGGITKTIHIDLTKSKDQIIKEFAKDTVSYLEKTQNLKIYTPDKLEKFYQSWKESVPFIRYVPSLKGLYHLKESFGEKAIFLITANGSAGAIFLKSEDSFHYWQSFSSETGRKELASYKIIWSAISMAKDMGVKIFDLEGIYDERFPIKTWKGFSHFKKSFGGKEIEYPGNYSKINLFLK